MIPLSDSPPERRGIPYVNLAIIALNILVFLYELTLVGPASDRFFLQFGTVPFAITHGQPVVGNPSVPPFLTLITSMFVHAGWLHIAGNMLFLWVFGDNVEDDIGHFKYLAFYLICGLVAGLSQVFVSPDAQVPAIGASGAIAGVLAAYVVMFPGALVKTIIFIGIFFTITRISALILIGFWILLQFVLGVVSLGAQESGGVAYFAHIGGFIAGFILIRFFPRKY